MTGGLLLAVVGLQQEARLLRGVTVICSGGDPVRATRLLHEHEYPGLRGVLSFGIAGGLDPALEPGDVVVATEVRRAGGTSFLADTAWGEALLHAVPGAKPGILAGHAGVVAEPAAKQRLRSATAASAVDLESEAAAAFAAERRVPFAALRAIADPAGETVPQAALAGLKPNGRADPFGVLSELLRRPGDLPALVRVAVRSRAALRALARAAASIGGDWGPPGVRLGLLLPVLGQGLLHMA